MFIQLRISQLLIIHHHFFMRFLTFQMAVYLSCFITFPAMLIVIQISMDEVFFNSASRAFWGYHY